MVGAVLASARETACREEERSAAAWRMRPAATALRPGVYRSCGPRSGSSHCGAAAHWLRTPAHHGARPVTAPPMSARPIKHTLDKGALLATDWPGTHLPLTPSGLAAERLLADAPLAPPLAPKSARSTPRAGVLALKNAAELAQRPIVRSDAESEGVDHRPYHWVPTQTGENIVMSACAPEDQLFRGTFVNSLSGAVSLTASPAVAWLDIELAEPHGGPNAWVVKRRPCCCVAGGSLVLCRGIVIGSWPAGGSAARCPEDGRIGRLPECLRPLRPLAFAAVAREAKSRRERDFGNQQLVTLTVAPDGWIRIEASLETLARSAVDLGAIRFSLDRGLALIDEVRLHTCTLDDGRRLAVVQGCLAARAFHAEGSPLLITHLPTSCRPRAPTPFIVPGARPGSYHLLVVRPASLRGLGGDVAWCDNKFQCTEVVSLSGLLYEVGDWEASLRAPEVRVWTLNRKLIVVAEFQNKVRGRFNELAVAWRGSFDVAATGWINFTQFCNGCQAVGYKGDFSRLWDMLDEDRSGEISSKEFSKNYGEPCCESLLQIKAE